MTVMSDMRRDGGAEDYSDMSPMETAETKAIHLAPNRQHSAE